MSPSFYVEQTLFVAIPLTFSFVHGLLFAFSPKRREHLYFALLNAFFAAAAYLEYEIDQGHEAAGYSTLTRVAIFALGLSAGRLIYALRDEEPPRRFYGLLLFAVIASTVGAVWPQTWIPSLVMFASIWAA
ncbi:MAG: hypothetical protein AAGA81_14425, partial [Acidobacteriota bacterium]